MFLGIMCVFGLKLLFLSEAYWISSEIDRRAVNAKAHEVGSIGDSKAFQEEICSSIGTESKYMV